MLYFALFDYQPNTAACNRIMAYLKAFSKYGVRVHVVYFKPNPEHSKFDGVLPNIEFKYFWDKYYIDVPKLNKLSLLFYLRRFVNSLKKGDIVYSYDFPDLIVALSKRQDIRVYQERTEHPDVFFRGMIWPVSKQRFLKCCQQAQGLLVISQGLKKYFVDNGCKPERVHIINMIVDAERFRGLVRQQCEPYIAYCGTVSNNKDGVDGLIKAFSIVSKKFPDYRLYIIGSAQSKGQSVGNYKLIEDLGIKDRVVFTGTVSRNDMPQILKNAKILALDRPNNLQAQYGFPTKLGEYLSTGNPVVITKVGDIPMFLQDSISALLAEPQNSVDFADKICWAIENEDDAKQIGEEGRRVAEAHFNYLIETKKMIDILNLRINENN